VIMFGWNQRMFIHIGLSHLGTTPMWLALFWSLHWVYSLVFGLVSLWLAVHGALMAQAAAAQLLTQKIRPPIPSAQEVISVAHDLAEFEGTGVKQLMEIPNVLGLRSNRMNKRAVDAAKAHGESKRHGITDDSVIVEGEETDNNLLPPSQAFVAKVRAQESLHTASHGGPGFSAAFDDHVQVFRQAQASFAGYDVYSRIALDASVTNFLMGISLYYFVFSVGRKEWHKTGWTLSAANVSAWSGLYLAMVLATIILKIDLFVRSKQLRMVTLTLPIGTVLTCVSVSMWSVGDFNRYAPVPSLNVALVAVLGQMLWIVVLAYEARPIKDHPLGLPSNFRAVRYLDVFGWTADSETRKEVVKNEKGQLVSEAVTEAKRIRRDIERILHAHDAQLNNEEIEKLMKAATMITKAIRNDSDIKQVIWLLMEKQTENSMKKQFFVHVPSELAQQEHPRDGRVVNLPLLAADTSSLLVQVGLNEPRTRNYSIGISEVGDDEDTSPRAASVRLPSGLPKLPGSRYSDYDLPWRYFRQIAVLVFTCWGVTFVVLSLFRLGAITEAPIKPVNTTLPHKPFKLSAFSCNKFLLALADGFEVHAAGRPTSHEDFEHIEGNSYFSLMLAEEVSFQWRSVTITDCEEADCSSLLLLDPSGHAVEERSTHLGSVRTRWTMHPDFTTPLLMISSLPPTVAKELCFRKSPKLQSATSGPGEHWGLMSATAVGEFVAFCPRGGHLEPVRAGVDVPRLHVEVIGLQVDSHGVLWTVLSSNAGHAELKAWSLNGTLRGTWALPKRRQWVPGMCEFSRGMVLADSGGSKAGVAAPQLWHVQPQLLGSADERHSSFTETLSLVM